MIDLSDWSPEEARLIADCIDGNDPNRECPACVLAAPSNRALVEDTARHLDLNAGLLDVIARGSGGDQ